jgi:hypothetical protein
MKHKISLFVKKTLWFVAKVNLVMWLMIGAGYFAKNYFPKTVYAEKDVVVTLAATTSIPILDKIVQCESGGSQYDRNGQVLIHANSNGSSDIGWGQINSALWGQTATKMGYDLSKEADNQAFTKWLFLNKGSVPWIDSSSCWNK